MSVLQNNPQFVEKLKHTLRSIALPALAGAAGTGALSGYLASKHSEPGEDPTTRRHRVLKNALLGSVLGGVTGAALPLGLSTLAAPLSDGHFPNPITKTTDALVGGTTSHLLPAATGAIGGGAMLRSIGKNRENAGKQIFKNIKDVENSPKDIMGLKAMLQTPEGNKTIIQNLSHNLSKTDPDADFKANELAMEAGGKGMAVQDILKARPLARLAGPGGANPFKSYLESQGPISRLLAKAVGTKIPFTDLDIAEQGAKYLRPSVGGILGGFRPLTKGLALGGAMLGANALQNRLEGD